MKEKIKKEKGSITLFVLIALLFFIIICIFIYTNINNKKISQNEELKQIEKNYETTNEALEEKYQEITENNQTT